MDAEYIKQHDVINRYVLHQLDEGELVAFEMYFLDHPEILDEIAEVESLKAGLATHRGALISPAPTALEQPISLFSRLSSWFESPAVLVGNFALIATLGVTLLLQPEASAPGGFAGDRVWVGGLRSDDTPQRVTLGRASLVFDIDVAMPGSYDVALLTVDGEPVERVTNIEASSGGLLVVFSPDSLQPGEYELVVSLTGGELALRQDLVFESSN